MEAYDAYLMARHLQWTPTPTAFDEARASYEGAIALDPRYAAPHTGLAEICHIAACGRGPTAQAHSRRVREEAGRALSGAAEAVSEHEIALREDPMSLICRAGYVLGLMSAGRRADAARESRRLLDDAPTFVGAYSLFAFDLPAAPLVDALQYAERGHALWSVGPTGLLAGLLRRRGDRERAKTLMQSIGDPRVYGNPVDHALFHLAQDGSDAAIPWIERTLDQHHPFGMMVLIGGPYGERIRASSGWPAVARKINLPTV